MPALSIFIEILIKLHYQFSHIYRADIIFILFYNIILFNLGWYVEQLCFTHY